jgi:hypothetical protein
VLGTRIDFFTAVNCGTILDQNFKSIMKYSGLNIDEYKIVVSIFMVIKLYYSGNFQYYVSLLYLQTCVVVKALRY